jgi:hypothetical protein
MEDSDEYRFEQRGFEVGFGRLHHDRQVLVRSSSSSLCGSGVL